MAKKRAAGRAKSGDGPTGDSIFERFQPVTEQSMREFADSASIERGRAYARGNQIFETTLRDETLRAECHGQSGGPYRVEATLVPVGVTLPDGSPIARFGCSCPRGDFCKHVVALLLTWMEAPERFEVRPPVAELLAGKSREELVALIELLIRRDPDVADLIELAPPAAPPGGALEPAEPGAGRTRSLSVATIARQVRHAFEIEGDDYGWDDYHAGSTVASQIAEVRAVGDGYAAAGRWADALLVYRSILEEATREDAYVRDDEGDLFVENGRSAAGLVRCLAAQAELPVAERLSPEDRAGLIAALYAFWEHGEDYDVEEDADPVAAIAAHATDEERARVEGWLRVRLDKSPEPAGSVWGGSSGTVGAGAIPMPNYVDYYRKRGALSFLAELKGDALSDEELLTEYQAAELWPDAAATMLTLGRVDEAIGVAGRKLNPIDLLPFADRLIAHDAALAPRALDLIEGWLWEHEGQNVTHEQNALTWLEDRYGEHGRPDRALEIARRRFAQQPGFRTYESVRAAARLPDRTGPGWVALRAELLTQLRQRKDWGTLVDVYLDEHEIDEALATLDRHDAGRKRPTAGDGGSWGGWAESSWDSRRRQVAEAVRASHPNEAIHHYQILAEDAIEGRNRSSYQVAAGYLAEARAVYLAQDRPAEWRTYITALRETHKRLRALREELDALHLG